MGPSDDLAPVDTQARRRPAPKVLVVGGIGLVAVIVVLAALVTGGGGGGGHERAARQLVEGFLEGDCDRVLATLSTATVERIAEVSGAFSDASDLEGVDLARQACPRIEQDEVPDAEVTGTETLLRDDARAVVRVTTSAPASHSLRRVDVYVVEDDDGWRVDLTLDVLDDAFLLSRALGERQPSDG